MPGLRESTVEGVLPSDMKFLKREISTSTGRGLLTEQEALKQIGLLPRALTMTSSNVNMIRDISSPFKVLKNA